MTSPHEAAHSARTSAGTPGADRAVPFHCPYCGDEDLRPHEPEEGLGHGQWECRSCLRAFSLKLLGLLPRPEVRS